jgi:hypothetical protein
MYVVPRAHIYALTMNRRMCWRTTLTSSLHLLRHLYTKAQQTHRQRLLLRRIPLLTLPVALPRCCLTSQRASNSSSSSSSSSSGSSSSSRPLRRDKLVTLALSTSLCHHHQDHRCHHSRSRSRSISSHSRSRICSNSCSSIGNSRDEQQRNEWLCVCVICTST